MARRKSEQHEPCDYCEGEGKVECAGCGGEGVVGYDDDESACGECSGDGRTMCETCEGSGRDA